MRAAKPGEIRVCRFTREIQSQRNDCQRNGKTNLQVIPLPIIPLTVLRPFLPADLPRHGLPFLVSFPLRCA